jgi:hypothetical protein
MIMPSAPETEETEIPRNVRANRTGSKVPPVPRQHSLIGFSDFKCSQDSSNRHPGGVESHVAAKTDSKAAKEVHIQDDIVKLT